MGLDYSSVVHAPITDVFDWHARPGAFHRLSPPWQPMRLIAEASSLEDGRATLALPGGLRWVAVHQPDGYDPPRRFVDALGGDGLATLPARMALRWRHTHEFVDIGDDRTRVIDRVETAVPGSLLRPMFDYRHRQLADDLAAHRVAAENGLKRSTIAVTGSSGLVGSALTAFLRTGGHRVIRLVRRDARDTDERRWDPADPDPQLLAGVDAVIHLAGASIAGRFTDKHRDAIRDSRIGPTRRLAELLARTDPRPAALISASAVGYYGYDRGDDTLSEDSDRGEGFLADVVADWEEATAPAQEAGLRVVRVRTGIVQSPRGGTLRLMRPLFAAGLGGAAGRRQAMAVLDRNRRPGRCVSPRAVGRGAVGARECRCAATRPQRGVHVDPGGGAASAGRVAGAVAGASPPARGGRAPANWPARASGWHPASSSRPGTGSVNPT